MSPLSAKSGESAQEPAKLWREPFDELRKSFQDYHVWLETMLESSSPGSQGAPRSSLPESDSQAV